MKPELTTTEKDGVTIYSITWSEPNDEYSNTLSEFNIFIKGDHVVSRFNKFSRVGNIISSGGGSWIQEKY